MLSSDGDEHPLTSICMALQVAIAFAEMHDTPVRMLAKGVLHGIVPWSRARPFLATRLKRRCAVYCLWAGSSNQFNRCCALDAPCIHNMRGFLKIFCVWLIPPCMLSQLLFI